MTEYALRHRLETQALFHDRVVVRFRAIERVARRKLLYLHAAVRLEALKGDRAGQHSIRINDQWRVCFVWRNGEANDVEIVDYH